MISGTRYRLTLEINRQLALARDINRAQTEISTNKRIQAPSDDPVSAARISQIGRSQADEKAWSSNLASAAALSARADTTLTAVGNALDRANELMVSGANGTLSDADRSTIALELRSLASELTALQGTKDPSGNTLFPPSAATQIPVGAGMTLAAVGTQAQVFDSVATSSGPQNLAAIVSAAADAFELSDPAARQAAVRQSLDDVGAAVAHVATQRGEQGARGNRIDQLSEGFSDSALQLKEERSGLEDTDVTAVVAQLQSKQLTLQAAQAVFAKVNQTTLFDLLR
jgi:flagellar hook-associated protein 3 FlgL